MCAGDPGLTVCCRTQASRQDEQLSWVLAALAALERENTRLRAEIERLSAEAARR